MLRRISTKLVVAVLATVILPFVVFAFFLEDQMADRLTKHVVQKALLGITRELSERIDTFLETRARDVEMYLHDLKLEGAIRDDTLQKRERAEAEQSGLAPSFTFDADSLDRWAHQAALPPALVPIPEDRYYLTGSFNEYIKHTPYYDLLLLVATDGRLVTSSTRHHSGGHLEREYLETLFSYDYSEEEWFKRAMQGTPCALNQHRSPYSYTDLAQNADPAAHYHIGFAAPAFDYDGRVIGALYALVNWSHIQNIVSAPVVKDAFRGFVDEDQEPSPYGWIWDSDGETILAHQDRRLYGRSVVKDVGLPQLTEAVRNSRTGWELYPEYKYKGEWKNAAFKRCRGIEEGGFGWVVGVGIDNKDIYANIGELKQLLLGGTAFVLLIAVAWTFLIAKRTTSPILELQRCARRVADGDLDAQVDIRSKDELGALAADFNEMTRRLKEQQARIIKAEKDAAWREMARQIAHDIKNPLTPIMLSIDLLERARRENAPKHEEIFERTMGLVKRQVEHLRRIAGDFYEFTGGRKPRLECLDVAELLEEVLHLHDAWAVELGVDVQREGVGRHVWADPDKLRRVLVNLASNALQAMPQGGALYVEIAAEGEQVRVSFRDTGVGISAEVRAHLFEPYFTTKSEGTGLGLAISKRVIEEMGGEIELTSAEGERGTGTIATVRLPACPENGRPPAE